MQFGGTLTSNHLGFNNQNSPSVKIPQMRSNPLPVSAVAGFYQQNQNPGDHARSPPIESPSTEHSNIFGSDSPGSYNNRELDDFIIDEILQLEDEQEQLRSGGLNRNSQALPLSFSCQDNLTALSGHQQNLGGVSASGHALQNANNRNQDQQNQQHLVSGKNNGGSSSSSMHSSGQNIQGSPPLSSNSFRQIVSSSAPSSSFDMEKFVRRGGSAAAGSNDNDFYRDRRKKDIHNMIERRRRYNINDRIKELGLMLPKSTAEDMKLNKGTILKASCDYIRQLRRERDIMLQNQQQSMRSDDASKQYLNRIRELEKALEQHGINVPPKPDDFLGNQRSMPRTIKPEPYDDQLSPSQTPTGSLNSGGFMTQLQEMQITSPGVYQPNGQMNQQSSPIPIHSSSRPIIIGSLPTDHHLSHQHYNNRNNQFYHSTSSPIATPNTGSQGGVSEYGTPNSTWSPLHSASSINPHQTLLVNTGNNQQQHHGQMIPGSAPSGGYSDLIMEDLSMQNSWDD